MVVLRLPDGDFSPIGDLCCGQIDGSEYGIVGNPKRISFKLW